MVKIPSKIEMYIKRVDKTHKGLGLPMVFSHISVLARKSVFFIGEMGTGKGTTISKTNKVREDTMMQEWFSFTLTEIANRVGVVADMDILFKIPEWSTLSVYHRDIFLTIISQVISDRSYYKEIRNKDAPLIHISNCDLTCLLAIQPLKFQKMMSENENWQSLASDRFVKFCLLNPLRTDTLPANLMNMRLPDIDYNYETRLYHEPRILMKMFAKQVSIGRNKLYAQDYLKAYCQFIGVKTAKVQHEIEFLQLFAPYITLWERMYYPKDYDIAKNSRFDIGGFRLLQAIAYLRGEVGYEDLADYFYLGHEDEGKAIVEGRTEQNIRNYGERLIRMELVERTRGSNVTFRLAGWLREHFDWYKNLISEGYMKVR